MCSLRKKNLNKKPLIMLRTRIFISQSNISNQRWFKVSSENGTHSLWNEND